jgi:hypothetical protein
MSSSYSPHAILNVRTWIAYIISWRPPVDRLRFRCNFTLKTSMTVIVFIVDFIEMNWMINFKYEATAIQLDWCDEKYRVWCTSNVPSYDNQISILGLYVVWLRVERVVLQFFRSFPCQKDLNDIPKPFEASATRQCQPRCPNSWAELCRSLRTQWTELQLAALLPSRGFTRYTIVKGAQSLVHWSRLAKRGNYFGARNV